MRRVELFVPCLVDQLYPQTGFNTVKLLEKAGCTVHYNPEITCCGFPPYDDGYWDQARILGQKFLKEMGEADFIVSPSPVCHSMVKKGYKDLFQDSADHKACRQVQNNIYEISDFLVNILGKEYFGAEFVGMALYHSACSSSMTSGGDRDALKLLSQVGGLEIIKCLEDDKPCGAGKSLSPYHEKVAVSMAEQKVKSALAMRADYIITSDPFCIMHLQSYIEKHNLPLKTIHLVDVLSTGWANI